MKNKPVILIPTDSELGILAILCENGPCTIRFVNDKLKDTRAVGFTYFY